MPAHVSQHLEPDSPRSICSPSVDAGHLSLRGAVDGASSRAAEALGDLQRLIDAEEELQDRLIGNTADDNHRNGDCLEHVRRGWPECTVGGVADPHGGTAGVRSHVQQEDGSRHGECSDVLWFQLPEFDARFAEVPQRNLDTTRHGAEHEAQHSSVGPVDVPSEDGHGRIERTGHVRLECSLEVVRPGGDVQVQEAWTKDGANERLPTDSDRGVDTTNEATVVTVCRHDNCLVSVGGTEL